MKSRPYSTQYFNLRFKVKHYNFDECSLKSSRMFKVVTLISNFYKHKMIFHKMRGHKNGKTRGPDGHNF